jgi:hypothetical protein
MTSNDDTLLRLLWGNYSLLRSGREHNALASQSDLTGAKFDKASFRIEVAPKRDATERAPQHPAAARSTGRDEMEAMPNEYEAI